MNKFRALPGLLATGALVCAFQTHAATVTTDIDSANSAKGVTESSCLQQLTVGVGDGENCMYDGGPTNVAPANPSGESIGPVNGAEYYDYGTTPAAFDDPRNFLPGVGDGKIRQVINGSITVDDNGNGFGPDDLVSFDLTLTSPNGGDIVRHLSTGLADRYTSLRQVLTSYPVDGATANAFGGFDYVIGTEGFPHLLIFDEAPCTGQPFGDSECDASFDINFCGDTLKWRIYDDGAGGSPLWMPTDGNPATDGNLFCGLPTPPGQFDKPHVGPPGSAGLGSLENNYGARATTGTVTGLDCEDGDGDPNTGDCTSSKVSFYPREIGPDNSSVPGVTSESVNWDHVYLKVSTDALGNVVSAEGFDLQESQVFGAGVFCGNDPGATSPTCNAWIAGHFTIATDVPVAADDADVTLLDTPVTVDVLANDVGFDDPVTVSLPGSGVSTEGGTIVINGANPGPQGGINITYTPAPGWTGSGAFADTFDYVVSEDNGSVGSATVTVDVLNVGANDDSATTRLDTTAVPDIRIGENDIGFTDPVTVVITVDPDMNGTAVVNGGGGTGPLADVTVTFTPDASMLADKSTYIETFTYQVTDSAMLVDTADVTVTVENIVPTAVDVVDASAPESGTAVTDVAALPGVELGDPPSTISEAVAPTNGMISITGNVITYSPDGFFTGNDSYRYTITDADNEESTATVSVTIGPKLVPTANPDSDDVDEGSSVQIGVIANDIAGSGPKDNHTVTISTPPANGTATVGAGNNIVTYTPNADFSGSDVFRYTLTDEDGDTSETTVSVTIIPTDVTPPPGGGGPVGPELPSASAVDPWSLALLALVPWLRHRSRKIEPR